MKTWESCIRPLEWFLIDLNDIWCEIWGSDGGQYGGSMFLRNVGTHLQVHTAFAVDHKHRTRFEPGTSRMQFVWQ
jgi:hypothetical protein